MSNTIIQIKRSSSTTAPAPGSLSPAEPAYSYVSGKAFIGNAAGDDVIEIGGKYYIDVLASVYNNANANSAILTAAFDKANSANYYAYLVDANATAAFTQANTARTIAIDAFNKANSANYYASLIDANAIAAFNFSNTVNDHAVAAFNFANTVNVRAVSAYTQANTATDIAIAAYANSNTKLPLTGGTITGDLSITGELTLTGNTIFANVSTLVISDPLLYLAGNNYTSDIVDIGFIANYVNATGSNVHTGLYREHVTKEYYLFQGYDEEPFNNHIDPYANGFSLSVLNADIRTSNLNLGGTNAIVWITNSYNKANSANYYAYLVDANTTSAFNKANTANIIASLAYDKANTANVNAGNASFLTVGTVPSARLTGDYSGITGLGTIISGTWNADVISVAYGGTGRTSVTQNGILYGNTTGALKVTSAGTEGQVLQADASGVPQFAMLDGGTF